nr:X2-like carbohydrate binding domain-containing protein [uncultured Cellulosilyticum sp.]
MSKRILRDLTQTIKRYARKVVLPMGLAMMVIAPNCVYAFDTEANEWKNVQIYGGGMMTGVVFSPAEKDLIYSRTDMGGVYRWIPETESWKPLTDWVGADMWSNLGCDGIAVDPSDANRVYMLMGEYDNGWTDVPGAVFCSNDKGDTWTVSELPFFCGSNMQGRLMNGRLTVDPNNSAVLYLGSRNDGLWKSEDYGLTWNKMSNFDIEGDFFYDKGEAYGGHLGITFVLCDPRSNLEGKGSQTIYVGIGNSEHSIYKTTDGGETWAPVVGEPRGKVTNEATGEWNMVDGDTYLPQQVYLTKEGIMYVTYATEAGPYASGYGDVWKYNTNTEEWKLISPKSSIKAPDDPWYGYQGLAVDPQDENTLVVTGQSWWPDMMMYRSTDGGETWTNVWEFTSYPDRDIKCNIDISEAPWLDWGSTHTPDYNSVASPKIGWNCGAIAIDPFNSDRMMYGTGATLYGTDNLTNWDKGEKFDIKVRAKGIEETVSNALLVIPDTEDDGLITSLFDINGFYHEDITKVPTIMANMNGDKYESLESSVDADYAELNPKIVFRVGERRAIDSYGSYANGMTISKDGGKTFSLIHDRIGNSEGGGEVAVSADGSVVLWATPDEPVSWSKGGYNWKACEGIPTNAMIASDRANANMFYGCSKDGKVYYSTDLGKTFEEGQIEGLPAVGSAQDLNIKAVKGFKGHVWVGTNKGDKGTNGLWHSTDGGKTYTKLDTVEGALSFGFGKAKEEGGYPAIYMAGIVEGKNGFFRSDDMGETWTRINDDEHQYGLVDPGCDITGDFDTYGRVYIGTNGRGVVYADTGSGTVAVPNASISEITAIFDKKEELQKDVTVTVNANGHTLKSLKANDEVLVEGEDYIVDGDEVTILKAFLAKQENGLVKITFDFDNGKDPILTINIKETINNATLETSTASFDQASASDVEVGMILNGNTLIAVKKDNVALTAGKEYTVVEDKVIFAADYLATLSKGAHEFVFEFSKGNNAGFVINVVNTAEKDSVVTPDEATFDKNMEMQADVAVNVELNGNTLEAIKLGDNVLVSGTEYIVGEEGTITFPASYLQTLAKGTYDFTFEFSAGEKQVVKVVVVDTTKTEVAEGAIAVEVVNKNGINTNALAHTFKLKVEDDSEFDISKLSIRYYFTNESPEVGATCWIDTAAAQYTGAPWYVSLTDKVTGIVKNMEQATDTANQYVELTFADAGILNNTCTLQIDTRVANNNWSAFDQSNDFSYEDATKIAVFYDGELISGALPN